jgi:hypothetical protein
MGGMVQGMCWHVPGAGVSVGGRCGRKMLRHVALEWAMRNSILLLDVCKMSAGQCRPGHFEASDCRGDRSASWMHLAPAPAGTLPEERWLTLAGQRPPHIFR